MSRRRKASGAPGRASAAGEERATQGPAAAASSEQRRAARSGGGGGRRQAPAERGPSLLVQIAVLAGIFVVTTLIAELAGAANLGIAIGIGQIVFALALVAMLLRGP
jgi:hypothetical protein